MNARRALRERLARDEIVIVPGAFDALSARVIQRAGFESLYVTGAGFTNSSFGVPDLAFIGLSDLVTHVARIGSVVDVPMIVDADTGYGGVLNVRRTIRELERAGAAAIQLEDQIFPKRCGHFNGTTVISQEEMVQKVRAAHDARTDPDLLLIIRTDARAGEGFNRAVERANAYVEAGADAIFVEAPQTLEELAELPRVVDAPRLVNMVEGGRTPLCDGEQLQALGFKIALFANTALRAATKAVWDSMHALRERGGTAHILDDLISWTERQELVGLPDMEALEDHYLKTTERSQ
jgi:2-methylisocitrate lyase-like PEP mutase family enzyme